METRTKLSVARFIDRMIFRYIPLAVAFIFVAFPFYWTIVVSLKSEAEIMQKPVSLLPGALSFDNYRNVWDKVGFSAYFFNSLMVAGASCLLIMTISLFTAYALSRFAFKGKNVFMLTLLCTQFVPGAMLIIPLFIIFKSLGIINSLYSLILAYTAFQVPFNAITLRGFIANIPIELEEAAYVDGCSLVKAIFLIVLPVLLPGLVASAAFAFIGCWNEYLFALMLINKKSLLTIPVGLSFLQGEYDIKYGSLAAGSVIALLPAIALFGYVQKYLVGGLTAGSVKG